MSCFGLLVRDETKLFEKRLKATRQLKPTGDCGKHLSYASTCLLFKLCISSGCRVSRRFFILSFRFINGSNQLHIWFLWLYISASQSCSHLALELSRRGENSSTRCQSELTVSKISLFMMKIQDSFYARCSK